MEKDTIWLGKRVYIKIKDSVRCYSGIVLGEDENIITIRDIRFHLVTISKSEIALLQEEGTK